MPPSSARFAASTQRIHQDDQLLGRHFRFSRRGYPPGPKGLLSGIESNGWKRISAWAKDPCTTLQMIDNLAGRCISTDFASLMIQGFIVGSSRSRPIT